MTVELNFVEFWRTIRRRLVLILSIAFFTMASVGVISFFVISPVYEESAKLLVQSQPKVSDQIQYNDLMVNQKLVKTYNEIITSRQIAQEVIKRLSLDTSVQGLLANVRVKAATDSLITTVIVSDADPNRAAAIANEFAKVSREYLNEIMKTDNVTILETAEVGADPNPVRPKPFLYMAVALAMGLALGISAVFLLEFMDKTVKDEKEIEELLGVPVLGVIAMIGADDKKKGQKKNSKVYVGEGATREV